MWNYYRDEPNNPPLVGDPRTVHYNAVPITNFASFIYKTSITGKTSNANQEIGENTEQKNTKTKTNLKNCCPIKNCCAIVVPILEQLKTGFERTTKWNKYRSEMTNQTTNNNLNYLIDQAFTNVNR